MTSEAKHIHIVVGTVGEYSDRSEWEVCAYFDKSLAEAHVKALDEATEKAAQRIDARSEREDIQTWELSACISLDSACDVTFDGKPFYQVVTLPVHSAVPRSTVRVRRRYE